VTVQAIPFALMMSIAERLVDVRHLTLEKATTVSVSVLTVINS